MTAGRKNGASIPYFSSPKPTKVPRAAPIIISKTVLPVPEEFRPTAIIFFPFHPYQVRIKYSLTSFKSSYKCSIFQITKQVRHGSYLVVLGYCHIEKILGKCPRLNRKNSLSPIKFELRLGWASSPLILTAPLQQFPVWSSHKDLKSGQAPLWSEHLFLRQSQPQAVHKEEPL